MTKVINFLYPAKITSGASGKIAADAGLGARPDNYSRKTNKSAL